MANLNVLLIGCFCNRMVSITDEAKIDLELHDWSLLAERLLLFPLVLC
jgi:hypothetical protein